MSTKVSGNVETVGTVPLELILAEGKFFQIARLMSKSLKHKVKVVDDEGVTWLVKY